MGTGELNTHHSWASLPGSAGTEAALLVFHGAALVLLLGTHWEMGDYLSSHSSLTLITWNLK